MRSNFAEPSGAWKVSLACLLAGLVAASAGAQAPGPGAGGPPSGGAAPAGASQVKKDNTPVPKSGVVSITFLGNKKITTEELEKAVATTDLKVGGPVGFSIIAPAMKAILAYYKEKGVALNLSPDIIEDPKGIAFVQFIIVEGGAKGDVGGLVSSGGPQIFCSTQGAGGGAAPAGGGQGGHGGAAGGPEGGTPGGGAQGAGQGGAPGGSGGTQPATFKKTDDTPIPASGIVSITFVGNKKVKTEYLQKVVADSGLNLGIAVNASVIAPAMKAIVAFYQKNGVNLNVSPDIIEDAKGIDAVQFIIDEDGKKGDIGGLVSSGGPHIFCE
jgi:hypothetical protein